MRGDAVRLHDSPGPANDQHSRLVLDCLGRIRSCGQAAEKLFGLDQAHLIGRRISGWISGLFPMGNSPSYNTRYLVHLCADDEWRKFNATDAGGHAFVVELNLSRTAAAGQEGFVLNLRLPDKAAPREARFR